MAKLHKSIRLFLVLLSFPIFSNPNIEEVVVTGSHNKNLEQDSDPLQIFTQKDYKNFNTANICLLYTSPSPRDRTRSRMPSSA